MGNNGDDDGGSVSVVRYRSNHGNGMTIMVFANSPETSLRREIETFLVQMIESSSRTTSMTSLENSKSIKE